GRGGDARDGAAATAAEVLSEALRAGQREARDLLLAADPGELVAAEECVGRMRGAARAAAAGTVAVLDDLWLAGELEGDVAAQAAAADDAGIRRGRRGTVDGFAVLEAWRELLAVRQPVRDREPGGALACAHVPRLPQARVTLQIACGNEGDADLRPHG